MVQGNDTRKEGRSVHLRFHDNALSLFTNVEEIGDDAPLHPCRRRFKNVLTGAVSK
jgi:hypothetical protein